MFSKAIFCLILMVGMLMSCSKSSSLSLEEYTLSNGLHVVLAPTKSHFTTVSLQYFVGGAFENSDQLGLSHLLEHLMFKTSKNLKTGEFNDILEKDLGGAFNAMTGYDSTVYYDTVPSEHTFRVLQLEAERMSNLTLVPEEVSKEKQVVLEEMRNRVENSDMGFMFDKASSIFFPDYPYGRDLGGKEGILGIPDTTIKNYYKSHYAPNNATLILAGEMIPGVKDEIKKVFGPIPRSPIQERTTPSDFHPPKPETFSIHRPVKINYVMLFAKIPPATSPLTKGLNALSYLLTNGNSSLLVQELVKKDSLVSEISTSANISTLPSAFMVIFTPYKKEDIPSIREKIFSLLKSLIKNPALPEKIRQTHLSMSTDYYNSLQDTAELATSIAQSMTLARDPNFLIHLQTDEISTKDTKDAVEWLLAQDWSTFTMLKK